MQPPESRIARHGLWIALAFFVATRLLVWAVALTAPQDRSRPGIDWWSSVPLYRWDAGHYGEISARGYPAVINDTAAFFPLYPVLARPLGRLLGTESGLVVTSHIAALLAIALIYLWARGASSTRASRGRGTLESETPGPGVPTRRTPRAAVWCVVLLSAYPPAMFLSTGYSDAVLLVWAAAALNLLDRERIWLAALVAALASATRPTGLAISGLVVTWALVYGTRMSWPRRLARVACVGVISIAGLLAVQAYQWHHYGRPDAFFAAQSGWAQKPVADRAFRVLTLKPVLQPAFRPIKYALRGQFSRLRDPDGWNQLFNITLVVLGIVGLIRAGPVRRIFYLLPIYVFLLAWLADPYRAGRLVGIARYQLIAVPAFLLASSWLARRRLPLAVAVVAGLLVLQCLYVRGFVDWRMVG